MIEVAAGLLFRNGRLLIAQRQSWRPPRRPLEFPGGKEGEVTFEGCLERELREELGIEQRRASCSTLSPIITRRRSSIYASSLHLPRRRTARPGRYAVAWVTRDELAGVRVSGGRRANPALGAERPELWGQSQSLP
ncbi:MAG: NUDIX domain-containing protein [Verrucomicrobiota bacterium]